MEREQKITSLPEQEMEEFEVVNEKEIPHVESANKSGCGQCG